MKAVLIFVLFIFILLSCQNEYNVNIRITNNSENLIDSITVTNGFDFVTLKSLDLNETKNCVINFKVKNPRHDGNYGIKIFNKNGIRNELFGYYSNGIPLNTNFDVEIKKDTIIIN